MVSAHLQGAGENHSLEVGSEGDPGQLLIPLRKTRKMDSGFLVFDFSFFETGFYVAQPCLNLLCSQK